MSGRAAVTLVVPVHEDAPALSRLLARLERAAPRPAEIVVVAGGSDTDVESLCAAHGCRLLTLKRPCRGRQLDVGAQAATQPVLWFVHADATLPATGCADIESAVAAGATAGCLRFSFAGPPGWQKCVIERLVALRVACGGVPYGDQSLFATRDAYVAAGGFAHEPLFEEVPLVRALRRQGRFVRLPARVRVATRRWERDGWWRRSLANRRLALAHLCGVSAATLARRYGHRAAGPGKEIVR